MRFVRFFDIDDPMDDHLSVRFIHYDIVKLEIAFFRQRRYHDQIKHLYLIVQVVFGKIFIKPVFFSHRRAFYHFDHVSFYGLFFIDFHLQRKEKHGDRRNKQRGGKNYFERAKNSGFFR